LILKNIKIF